MASINYVSLSALKPLELQYQFFKDENFKNQKVTYRNGFNFFYTEGLKNFQDVVINRETCLVLTSAIELGSTFTGTTEYTLGNLPGSVYIQPRNSLTFYGFRNPRTRNINLNQDTGSIFYIKPIPNTRLVEILVDNHYLQVSPAYPYIVTTSRIPLSRQFINRQRFECIYQNGTITFKTLTNTGYRYLCFGSDNILRATGVVLNNAIVNDYVFTCTPVTRENIFAGFNPTNSIGTYFSDFVLETENNTLNIKKIIPTKTNLLISFPIKRNIESSLIPINVANLKTTLTPSGGPASINNS
jgi:hypothetical protein